MLIANQRVTASAPYGHRRWQSRIVSPSSQTCVVCGGSGHSTRNCQTPPDTCPLACGKCAARIHLTSMEGVGTLPPRRAPATGTAMGEKKPTLKRPRIGNEADESAAQPRDLNQDVGSSHTVSRRHSSALRFAGKRTRRFRGSAREAARPKKAKHGTGKLQPEPSAPPWRGS